MQISSSEICQYKALTISGIINSFLLPAFLMLIIIVCMQVSIFLLSCYLMNAILLPSSSVDLSIANSFEFGVMFLISRSIILPDGVYQSAIQTAFTKC